MANTHQSQIQALPITHEEIERESISDYHKARLHRLLDAFADKHKRR